MAIPKIADLFDLSKTLARPLLEQSLYPWEALVPLRTFIISLGQTLPKEIYEEIAPQVWAAKDASIAPSASIWKMAANSWQSIRKRVTTTLRLV